MRTRLGVALPIVLLCVSTISAQSKDPCASQQSNKEMRDCYTAEQKRANSEVDALVNAIGKRLRGAARDSGDGALANDLVRKAALTLVEAQGSWKNYADQHCRAVEFTWTTGSGAGTAYEACMYNLAKQRIRDLRRDFEIWAPPTKASH
jgi:uncharacterized protein YecT (DUF1311 family)